MSIAQLTSSNNPLLKIIRLISSGSRRAPKDLVVAEGIRVLEEAHRRGCRLDAVVISENFGHLDREEKLLNFWISQDLRICRAGTRLFSSISDLDAPQGALALVRFPESSLDIAPPAMDALILFACGVQDPGNLGTLIRTSAASGAGLVCTSKGTVSARNPKAIRASAGAIFHIPVVEHMEISEFLHYCNLHGIRIYRTDVREGMPYTEADFRSRCAFLVGNEGSGLRMGGVERVPSLRIPMAGGIESLNVASAGAILLFEACRQRMLQR